MGTEGLWLIHWLQVYIFNKPIVDNTPNLMYPFKNGYCPNISKMTEFKNYYHVRNLKKKLDFLLLHSVAIRHETKMEQKNKCFHGDKGKKKWA